MSPHAQALGLADAAADAGCTLVLDHEGLGSRGDLPEALRAAVATFVGEGEHREALPGFRALAAVLRAPSRAAQELLGLPVVCAKVPGIAYAVTLERKGICSVFTTSRAIFDRESGTRPVWRYPELDAMARAHDQGRVYPAQWDHWINAKQRGAERGEPWWLTPMTAGCLGSPPAPTCTFGELFEAVGVAVVGVELEGDG